MENSHLVKEALLAVRIFLAYLYAISVSIYLYDNRKV